VYQSQYFCMYNGPLLCSFNVPIKGLTLRYLLAKLVSKSD